MHNEWWWCQLSQLLNCIWLRRTITLLATRVCDCCCTLSARPFDLRSTASHRITYIESSMYERKIHFTHESIASGVCWWSFTNNRGKQIEVENANHRYCKSIKKQTPTRCANLNPFWLHHIPSVNKIKCVSLSFFIAITPAPFPPSAK